MKYKEITYKKEINAYLKKGDANLGQLGFTDHSQAHCVQVAHQAGKILERFGYSEHEIELVKIAGFMIDESICSMYDYFEIFLGRMMLCRKSAEILGTTFKLTVNGRKVL